MQLPETLAGALGLVVQARAEAPVHLIEPMVERIGHMRLGAHRLIGEIAQLAGKVDQSEFEGAGPPHRLERFFTPPALASPGKDGDQNEQKDGEAAAGQCQFEQRQIMGADADKRLIPGHRE